MKHLYLIALLGLVACGPVVDTPMTPLEKQEFAACSANGLDYFKDVEYFPYLHESKHPSELVTSHVSAPTQFE